MLQHAASEQEQSVRSTWAGVAVPHLRVLVLARRDGALKPVRVLDAALFVAVAVGLDIACEHRRAPTRQTPEGEAEAWLRTRAQRGANLAGTHSSSGTWCSRRGRRNRRPGQPWAWRSRGPTPPGGLGSSGRTRSRGPRRNNSSTRCTGGGTPGRRRCRGGRACRGAGGGRTSLDKPCATDGTGG